MLTRLFQSLHEFDRYLNPRVERTSLAALCENCIDITRTSSFRTDLFTFGFGGYIFNIERHVLAWLVGGVFAFLAIVIAFVEMVQHCRKSPDPVMRRYVLRILFMVPLYAMQSWLGLLMRRYTEYWDLAREVRLLLTSL